MPGSLPHKFHGQRPCGWPPGLAQDLEVSSGNGSLPMLHVILAVKGAGVSEKTDNSLRESELPKVL